MEPSAAVVVAGPPALPTSTPVSPLARLLPVVMVLATVGMTVLLFSSGMARNPMFLLFPVMMIGSALGSLAYASRGGQRAAELDEDRRRYLSYLDGVEEAAAHCAAAQREALERAHPHPGELWLRVDALGGVGIDDPDFGHVRIGVGPRALAPPLVAPEVEVADARDPVTFDALDALLAAWSSMPDLPVTVDVFANALVVVDGPAARELARAMVCQLAARHGPDTVAVGSIVAERTAPQWDWLKWLPHHRRFGVRDDAGPARLAFRDAREAAPSPGVRLLAVCDGGFVPAGWTPADGVTVLAVGVAPVALRGLDALVLDSGGERDSMSVVEATVCARRLARRTDGRRAVTVSGWADLVGIGEVERIAPQRVWRPRRAHQWLRVPIGLDEHGEPVELDVKEAAHGGMGPHGLCVGATGSGKSEFLRTLALGLVATHPPDVLNLVLVDFKGGATFLGFERLNHVSAVITNLASEAHLVTRMRDALSGELTRRQELLRHAGNFANVAQYEAARGPGTPPLPTLLVIVDEFAELLSAQPEFIDLFVAIGRVGRSLGVHLLLASQRLEEGRLRGLETHLSYRVCLKTFSASESRAVLGTTAAYELPNAPGVGYLKTAAGTLTKFQAAFVSQAVTHHVTTEHSVSSAVPFTAAPVGRLRPEQAEPGVVTGTLLDTVLSALAGHGPPAHQVWIPPLQASPTLGSLLGHRLAALTVPIGLVDDPLHQRRDLLTADLRGSGGHVAVVGGPRSGKSTTLQTLLLALAALHDPAAVQCYGLDFGGGALSALGGLPHVGAVAGRYDHELVARIIGRLQKLVRERDAALRSPAGLADCAHVFLVVDGWSAARHDVDGLEEAVTMLAVQGLSVGVHVVIAATRWAELRPALKDQLGTRVELRLGDPADSEHDRKRARLLLDRPAGHGITAAGLELVIALPLLEGDATTQAAVELLTARHPEARAETVTPVPTQVMLDGLVTRAPAVVTLGVDEDLAPFAVDFGAHPHLLVLGEAQCGKTATLRALCRELVRCHAPEAAQLLIIDVRRTLLGVVETDHLRGYAMSAAAADAQLSALDSVLRGRLPHDAVTQRELRDRSWWSGPEFYVVIDDFDVLAGSTVNPAHRLVELLPQARDLGLHLIVARRSGGAARAMFDPLLSGMRELGCLGLVMSASPDEGVLLGSARPRPMPPGRATVVRRGAADHLLQVAWSERP